MSKSIHEITKEIKNLLNNIGVYNSDVYSKRCSKKVISGEVDDMNTFLDFDYRIQDLEERINHKLPEDYVAFIKDHNGKMAGYGEWLFIEDIQLATEYDIKHFQLIRQENNLLTLEDLKFMIPIYFENDSYVLLDLRENGKGVFIIWSDELELAFQSKNFTEFKESIVSYAESEKLKGNDFVECDCFSFDFESFDLEQKIE